MKRSLPWAALVLALGWSGASSAQAPPPAPAGSFGPEVLHMPTLERRAEQGILRPVPISATLPPEIALRARRVLVHYRLWGDPDWTALELRRTRARYDGAIPCREISTVTGDLKYYIRVHDAEGHVIATGASRAKPYRVAIKHDDALAPGAPRVQKCPDPADCPAGLQGCPSERVVEIQCKTDGDCEGGMTCSWRGFCERADRPTNLVSVAVEQDFGVVRRSGACSIHAQEKEGYACFRSDGAQYVGTAVLTNEPLGVGRGPTRIVIGYDRLVYFDTSVGARVGWALAGEGPTSRGGTLFLPFSASVRATHWFGEDPLAHSGLRALAFLAGGYAMVDVETEIHVREDPTVISRQGGNDLEQTLALWKRAGDGFIGVGGGLSFAFGTRVAAFAELGADVAFPIGAFVLAPSGGLTVGF